MTESTSDTIEKNENHKKLATAWATPEGTQVLIVSLSLQNDSMASTFSCFYFLFPLVELKNDLNLQFEDKSKNLFEDVAP